MRPEAGAMRRDRGPKRVYEESSGGGIDAQLLPVHRVLVVICLDATVDATVILRYSEDNVDVPLK